MLIQAPILWEIRVVLADLKYCWKKEENKKENPKEFRNNFKEHIINTSNGDLRWPQYRYIIKKKIGFTK